LTPGVTTIAVVENRELSFAIVEPGDYGVMVVSYTSASLPFRIRAEAEPTF
jgi:hypothetical protein